MSYYDERQSEFSVRESAVNCAQCTSDFKCCTYRPFIANFLAGKIFAQHQVEDSLFEQWDMLMVGLAPSLSYRKQFAKKGKWGFGSDKSLLCAFYETKNGSCKIWSARPSVCRTFFCKSSYGDQGMGYWKKAEEFSWRLEWVLLEDFLFEEGWILDDIAIMKRYLNEDYLKNPFVLPAEFKFTNVPQAREFYLRAHEYVSRRSTEQVQEIIGLEGQKLYSDVLAEKAILR